MTHVLKLTALLLMLSAVALMAACGGQSVGTVPSPTPLHTAGPTATPTSLLSDALVSDVENSDTMDQTPILDVDDIFAVIGDDVTLSVQQLAPSAIEESETLFPAGAIEDWSIIVFKSPGAGPTITLSIMKLATEQDARAVFRASAEGLSGERVRIYLRPGHIAIEPNASGLGSAITFVLSDRAVTLTASLPPDGKPLIDVMELALLANIVARRIDFQLAAERQAPLDEAIGRWNAFASNDYMFEFKWVCFCVPPWVTPVLLTVSDGAVLSAVYVENGNPVPEGGQLNAYETVDALFDRVQDAIDRKVLSIAVEYHPKHGYPVSGYIDYDIRDDEERGFEVSNLTVIAPGSLP